MLDSGVLVHIVALASSSSMHDTVVGKHKKSRSRAGGTSKDETQQEKDKGVLRVDAEVRSEASWVILNASSCGSDAQIEQLVECG